MHIYSHSYLIEDATGAYQAVGPDRYGDMRKINDLLKVHGQTGPSRNVRLTELEAYMQSMRGQALPQSPPGAFLAAIQKAMRKAAGERRQLVVSNLPLDVTAVGIGRFFGALQVEMIAIAYDSITDLPTGFANVDFNTAKDAQAALKYFSETSLRGEMVTLELKAIDTDEDHEQLIGSHLRKYQAATHKVDMDDKITADVARAWSPGSGMKASNTGSSSATAWSAFPADDHDMADGTDVEDARERAKTGQGSIRLHLQKLEAFLKMANQERAKFGLPPMRRVPDGPRVSIKK